MFTSSMAVMRDIEYNIVPSSLSARTLQNPRAARLT
jgi:hypothetical protein